MIRLVAFLGNYGRTYENTRHNAAWLFADSLPFAHRLSWQHKFKGDFCSLDTSRLASWADEYHLDVPHAEAASDTIFFLKPETYMNASGESIVELANFYKLTAEHILVVHDELELPPGTISLKKGGGLGGHNGLRSTKAVLNTADFWRFRFGIGRPDDPDVAAYVLAPFTSDERITMAQTFTAAAIPFIEAILAKDPGKLIAAWGKKKVCAD